MLVLQRLLLLPAVVLSCWVCSALCTTNGSDYGALVSLASQWSSILKNWTGSDPCDTNWDGVICHKGQVTGLILSDAGITGPILLNLWGLTELEILNLSFNPGLTGSIPHGIQNLQDLKILILTDCSLSGTIPAELGNIPGLTFLALNSNNLTGSVPANLGRLTKLEWFDISNNQITGNLMVSNGTSPGLDLLVNAKHFHFYGNQLSGELPEQLFSSNQQLVHVRLDQNNFSGSIPKSINNLTRLQALYLGYNQLTGTLPNLSGMNSLEYLDLSNNSFDPSIVPPWFSSLQSLTTLMIESASLQGTVPEKLFSLPQLQLVKMSSNNFSGTFDMGTNFSSVLQLVDLQYNSISRETTGGYNNKLLLRGNPYCNLPLANSYFCQPKPDDRPYSTDISSCGNKSCADNEQQLISVACGCAAPLTVNFTFIATLINDVSNKSLYRTLEQALRQQLNLTVRLQNIHMDQSYLQVQALLFPLPGTNFSFQDILEIVFGLANQSFVPPQQFGPYIFVPLQYSYPPLNLSGALPPVTGNGGTSRLKVGGIAGGASILVLILVLLGFYALRQKKRVERMTETNRRSEALWMTSDRTGESNVPQLKGARRFSFEELNKYTGSFSPGNEIGHGGYGKVYRGVHPDGQTLAIKRAQQGSIQGALQFKTEIELLSRVHHKNLVGLVGFCIEQGEQMLVYEFMVNGSLRESLSGRSGIRLDWKRRLRVALGAASGLAYLHELVSPTIIHRDVKSANILLDEKLTARVADFGLSKLLTDDAKGHVSTQVKGTMGYLDPEYYMTLRLTEKSDVYSFGVVMLELITSKQPIESGKYIVREVRTALNRSDGAYFGLGNIMDPTIKNEERLVGFGKFLELALHCVEELSVDRPSMVEVVKVIDEIIQANEMHSDPTSITSSSAEFRGSKLASRHPYSDASLSNYSSSIDHIGKFEQN